MNSLIFHVASKNPRPDPVVESVRFDIPTPIRPVPPLTLWLGSRLLAAAWRRRALRFLVFANAGAEPKLTPRRNGSRPATHLALARSRTPRLPASRRGSPRVANA